MWRLYIAFTYLMWVFVWMCICICVCVPLLLNGAPQKFFSLKFVEDLKGEFTNFHRGSWRFVSMRGTQITWFRACGNYQTSSDDEKKKRERLRGERPLLNMMKWLRPFCNFIYLNKCTTAFSVKHALLGSAPLYLCWEREKREKLRDKSFCQPRTIENRDLSNFQEINFVFVLNFWGELRQCRTKWNQDTLCIYICVIFCIQDTLIYVYVFCIYIEAGFRIRSDIDRIQNQPPRTNPRRTQDFFLAGSGSMIFSRPDPDPLSWLIFFS